LFYIVYLPKVKGPPFDFTVINLDCTGLLASCSDESKLVHFERIDHVKWTSSELGSYWVVCIEF
jgi:hypothetical protein